MIKIPNVSEIGFDQSFKKTPFVDNLDVDDSWPNPKLYGKIITMSGWGETEKLYASKELLWTHERVFKYNADLISRKLIYQTGNPQYNFMGEKKTKNGGCTGDSGGKPSKGQTLQT